MGMIRGNEKINAPKNNQIMVMLKVKTTNGID
jgi:hypothetical protein